MKLLQIKKIVALLAHKVKAVLAWVVWVVWVVLAHKVKAVLNQVVQLVRIQITKVQLLCAKSADWLLPQTKFHQAIFIVKLMISIYIMIVLLKSRFLYTYVKMNMK